MMLLDKEVLAPTPANSSLKHLTAMADLMRRLTRASAAAVVITSSLILIDGSLIIGLPFCAGVVGVFFGLRLIFLRWDRASVDELVERFETSSREHPRHASMQQFLDSCCGTQRAQLLLTSSPSASAATRGYGTRIVVEVPVGFLRRHAPLPRGRGNAPILDVPIPIQAMLAHEAGHAVARDPIVFFPAVAEVVGALVAAMLGVIAIAVQRGTLAADALALVGCAGVMMLGWAAAVRTREVVADAWAAKWLGALTVRTAYSEQLKTEGGLDRGRVHVSLVKRVRGALARFLFHPDLAWRSRVVGASAELGLGAMILMGCSLIAPLESLQRAGGNVATLLGVTGMATLLFRLPAFAWTAWCFFQLFWFDNANRRYSRWKSVAVSVGRVLLVAACMTGVKWLFLNSDPWIMKDPVLLYSGGALCIALWACANLGLMIDPRPQGEPPRIWVGTAIVVAVGFGSCLVFPALNLLGEWLVSVDAAVLVFGAQAERFSAIAWSSVAGLIALEGSSGHFFSHPQLLRQSIHE